MCNRIIDEWTFLTIAKTYRRPPSPTPPPHPHAGCCTQPRSPVIFVGPFEHHSNLLPWRESCGEVVTIGENSSSGGLDLDDLEEQLRRFAGRKLKIGAWVWVYSWLASAALSGCPMTRRQPFRQE